MTLAIRIAGAADVPRMTELADHKRAEYAQYQPVFWRPAADAARLHAPSFAALLASSEHIALVHKVDDLVDGFVIAAIAAASPVYDPGGLTCIVDDFVVAEPSLWPTLGLALLHEAMDRARQRGAVQIVVVCAQLDQPKRG